MKVFSSHKSNLPVIHEINDLIKRHHLVMIEVKNKKAFFLIKHHKYIDYKRDAKRMLIGTVNKTEDGFYYFDRACAV